MAYDPAVGAIVLVTSSGATWSFSSGNWTDLNLATSPGSSGYLFYDGPTGALILWDYTGSQTWEFTPGVWTDLHPAISPTGYDYLAAAYDSYFGYGVVVDAAGNSTGTSTWTYANNIWVNETGTVGSQPGDRETPEVAYDSTDGYTVLLEMLHLRFSGNSSNQTWLLHDPLRVNVSGPGPAQDLGQRAVYQVEIAGGIPPDMTKLLDTPEGCAAPSNLPAFTTVDCLFNRTGSFELNITTSDFLNYTVSAALPLTVYPAMTSSTSVRPNPATVGIPVTLAANVSGGAPPFDSTWTISPGPTDNGTSTSIVFATSGTYLASFTVKDAAGATLTRMASIAVNAVLSVVAALSTKVTDTGLPVMFEATAMGGTAPLGYTWHFGDGVFASMNDTTHTYSVPGDYQPAVWVNDSAGDDNLTTLQLLVNPSLEVNATSNTTRTGLYEPVLFSSTVSGGTGPFTYWWNFGNQGSNASQSTSYAFTTLGNHTVSLIVNDSVGASRTQSITVDVVPSGSKTSPPVNGTGANRVPTWQVLLIGGVAIAVIVVGVGVVVMRSRRSDLRASPARNESRR